MKKIIVTGAVAAIAAVSFAGTASAAPSANACFGQTHKAVNAGAVDGVENVGQLVQGPLVESFGNKGQGKKSLVYTAFCP
jgi:hypothetical protein